MVIEYSVEALAENLEELRKLNNFENFRNFLKFFLIGFAIGRNNLKRIRKIASETYDILFHLIEKQLKKEKITPKEKSTIIESLIEIEELTKSHRDYFGQHRKKLGAKSQQLIGRKIGYIESQVHKIIKTSTYLTSCKKKKIDTSIDSLKTELEKLTKTSILNGNYLIHCIKKLETAKRAISNHNATFIKQQKKDYHYLWNNGSFTLDNEQQTAVIIDDKHNLVVAAAGSGKTEVLITRIAYLINRKTASIPPNRILAIAYQRKAMEEIKQRLQKRYDINGTTISTFHKLGKDILEESRTKYRHTDIINENKKHEIVEKIFQEKIAHEQDFYQKFLDFVKTIHDKDDEQTTNESLEYALEHTYFSIDGTQVNSRAEKEIMDFFLMHKLNGKKIKVRYEADVEAFRPDFYLPDYDLYFEHWGLTKTGKVPDWFSQTTEEYKKSMELKKKWFSDNNKPLLETFAYEYDKDHPDRFINLLKKRVIAKIRRRHNGTFKFSLKSYDEIVEIVWKSYRTPIDDLLNFITTAKTYGLSPQKIKMRLEKRGWSKKQIAFGNLVLPIYKEYEKILHEYNEIDFEDMINKAITELEKNPTLRVDFYDHILIDEYQDISAQRYRLLKKLMNRNPECKLFCVGDDWQSIMGFSGSNVNYFVKFADYFENPAITTISTNYRSNSTIVNAGATLIKNNTSCQIQKPVKAKNQKTESIQILKSPHKKDYEYKYHQQTAEDCIHRIISYLKKGYSTNEILILTRCMRTRTRLGYRYLPFIREIKDLAKKYDLKIVHNRRGSTKSIRLLTVHASKGLEAKIVFLLNATNDTFGFPCLIEDSKIYEPARVDYPPQDSLEEERRIFYVAMTRAKEHFYIYTWEPAMSEFLNEITDYTKETRLNY